MTDDGRQFHITIGAAIASGVETLDVLANDLRLAKAAALYGDRATLCSFPAHIAFEVLSPRWDRLTFDERMTAIAVLGTEVSAEDPFARRLEDDVRTYRRLRGRSQITYTRRDRDFLRRIKTTMRSSEGQIQEWLVERSKRTGLDQLQELRDTGLLDVYSFGSDEEPAEAYLHAVERAVTSHSTYPLFDETTGELIREQITDGAITTTPVNERRARQVALASGLMGWLPVFERASVKEVLDIRAELQPALVAFRGAMVRISKDAPANAWDKDFPAAVEEIYHGEVAPALKAIEEATRQNTGLRALVMNLDGKDALSWAGAALAIGAAFTGHIDNALIDVAAKVAEVAIAAKLMLPGLAKARYAHEDQRTEIEAGQFYFLYKTRKALEE